jgi:hypothetical protein
MEEELEVYKEEIEKRFRNSQISNKFTFPRTASKTITVTED